MRGSRRANISRTRIHEVQRATEFVVRAESAVFRAPALVVATGGLSIPKMGATGFGYDVARQFGLNIRATRPALVPLVLGANDRNQYCDLAGVSAEVVVSTDDHVVPGQDALHSPRAERTGNPANLFVLECRRGDPHRPGARPRSRGGNPRSQVRNVAAVRLALQGFLPHRFAKRWVKLHAPAAWNNPALAALDRQTHEWLLVPERTEGYEKAEVTAGGVDTDELSSKTMESRKVPGLFFIGEVVDVTGHLGGHNFQWAWASGASAGRAL